MTRPRTLAIAACTLTLGGAPALADAADADRRVTVTTVTTKAAAGVGPRASDTELGGAAITKHARQLKLGGHTGLRLADSVALPGVRDPPKDGGLKGLMHRPDGVESCRSSGGW